MAGLGSPCGACKFLRRKCLKGCVFAPYFCHEQGAAHFAAIHKVFGASNVSKLLMRLPVDDRSEAALTISYEAQTRLQDPVYGCVAHIFALQQQVVTLQAQLESLQAQASQVYANEPLVPIPQEFNVFNNKFMTYQQGEDRMPHIAESCASVKSENKGYFGSKLLTCTSMQSSQGYNTDKCTRDYRSLFHGENDPTCTIFSVNLQEIVQKTGYYDAEDFQSVPSSYLN
ncbi:hypothetical protein ACP70R_005807 [Stipagrostis hirtigluma subsp. patula]